MFQHSKNVGGFFSTNYIQCLDLVPIIKTFMCHRMFMDQYHMNSSTVLNTDVFMYVGIRGLVEIPRPTYIARTTSFEWKQK